MSIAKSKLLYNDKPAVIGRDCARKIGIAEALVLQTLHFALLEIEEMAEDERNTRHLHQQYHQDGQWWLVGTYQQFAQKQFNFANARQLRSLFDRLEARGLVIARPIRTDGGRKAGKRYRIQQEAVNQLAQTDPDADTIGSVTLPKSARYADKIGSLREGDTARIRTVTLTKSAPSSPIKDNKNPAVEEKENSSRGQAPQTQAVGEPTQESRRAAVAALLRDFGVWEQDAEALAQQYDEATVRQQIEALPYRMERIRNPPALLVDVLRQRKLKLPPAYLKAKHPPRLRIASSELSGGIPPPKELTEAVRMVLRKRLPTEERRPNQEERRQEQACSEEERRAQLRAQAEARMRAERRET